jgi:DNA-binding CsgD family transcriptional regulator
MNPTFKEDRRFTPTEARISTRGVMPPAEDDMMFKHAPLISTSVVHHYDLDIKGRILSCNLEQAHHAGYASVQALIGKSFQEFIPYPCAERIIQNNHWVIGTEQTGIFVESYVLFNHRFVALSYKAPLYARNKNTVLGITGHSFILDESAQPQCRLSVQQLNCIVCLIRGMTLKQISVALGLSEHTVKNHLERAKEKLNCKHRVQLIAAALKYPAVVEQVFLWLEFTYNDSLG